MSDAYLTDDEGRIASLGLAALTAYMNNDKQLLNQITNEHLDSAPSPIAGAQDVTLGLLFTAGALLRDLSKETGRSCDEILQGLGVLYAERGPDGQA
ncbi:hypothetical protein [Micromonospora haikouensis]|uniref:hypothetical protein n=1 Tax=Micromonospora haikouensis TaxID=686309 RepID=UPI003D750BD6